MLNLNIKRYFLTFLGILWNGLSIAECPVWENTQSQEYASGGCRYLYERDLRITMWPDATATLTGFIRTTNLIEIEEYGGCNPEVNAIFDGSTNLITTTSQQQNNGYTYYYGNLGTIYDSGPNNLYARGLIQLKPYQNGNSKFIASFQHPGTGSGYSNGQLISGNPLDPLSCYEVYKVDNWEATTQTDSIPVEMGSISNPYSLFLKNASDSSQVAGMEVLRNHNFDGEAPLWDTDERIMEFNCGYALPSSTGSTSILLPPFTVLQSETKTLTCSMAASWNWIEPLSKLNFIQTMLDLNVSSLAEIVDKIKNIKFLGRLNAFDEFKSFLESLAASSGGIGSLDTLKVNYLYETPAGSKDITKTIVPTTRQRISLPITIGLNILGGSVIAAGAATLAPPTVIAFGASGAALLAISHVIFETSVIRPIVDITQMSNKAPDQDSSIKRKLLHGSLSIESINNMPDGKEKDIALLSTELITMSNEYEILPEGEQASKLLIDIAEKLEQMKGLLKALEVEINPSAPPLTELPTPTVQLLEAAGVTSSEILEINTSIVSSPWINNHTLDRDALFDELVDGINELKEKEDSSLMVPIKGVNGRMTIITL